MSDRESENDETAAECSKNEKSEKNAKEKGSESGNKRRIVEDEDEEEEDDKTALNEKKKMKKDSISSQILEKSPLDLASGDAPLENKKIDENTEKKSVDHTSQVAEHYNSLEEKGISQRNQSRIVYMRNFNNWIKSMLINMYLEKVREDVTSGSPLRVLDMCCGKGGDLLKWRKAHITHLICADIAGVSVEQCQSRYNEMLSRNDRGFAPVFSAEFLTYDCTKVRLREKVRDPSVKLDLVSCQFAFHYSFETLPQAECMLRNAAEMLRPGGFFIATIPHAYHLVSRWHQCEGNKFGNDIYKVDFQMEKDKTPPLFGAKYNFCLEGVVNCPEFLVHPPTLRKLARKFGLECTMFESFEEFYERTKTSGRQLLGRMQTLETYPPFPDTQLLGQALDDYEHADEYMKGTPKHRNIGTLSLSEWQATSLYAVMAFKKMKTMWNAEGKPEYA